MNSTLRDHPNVKHVIIINPNNGADFTSAPNTAWADVVNTYKDYDNAQLIGYVPTGYGNLTLESTAQAQIDGAFTNGWHIQGIFFDEVSGRTAAEQANLLEMHKRYMQNVHSHMTDTVSVFNIGSKYMIDGSEYNTEWLNACEKHILYENSHNDASNPWNTYTMAAAGKQLDKFKFNAMLRSVEFGTGSNYMTARTYIEDAWNKHFGSIYLTDETTHYNDFLGSEDYWLSFVSAVDDYQGEEYFNMTDLLDGDDCYYDDECTSSQCKGSCCKPYASTYTNCAVCSATGDCAQCAFGTSFVSGQGCVASSSPSPSPTPTPSPSPTPTPSGAAGDTCSANGDCTDSDCRTRCCSQWLNDANCGVCDTGGWCETCSSGYTFNSATSKCCLLYTSPSPRDQRGSRMPSSA